MNVKLEYICERANPTADPTFVLETEVVSRFKKTVRNKTSSKMLFVLFFPLFLGMPLSIPEDLKEYANVSKSMGR